METILIINKKLNSLISWKSQGVNASQEFMQKFDQHGRKCIVLFVQWLNEIGNLEYKLTQLGKEWIGSYQYVYIGFYDKSEREKFINNQNIVNKLDKFTALSSLDTLFQNIIIKVTHIPQDGDLNEIKRVIENKFCTIINTISEKVIRDYWTVEYEIITKCSKFELNDT